MIAGVGSRLNGDDAAGLIAARRLGGVECTSPIDLLSHAAGADAIVIIDAMRSGRRPGEVVKFENGAIPEAFRAAFASTHGFSVLDAIALGRQTGALPERVTLYGIEAGPAMDDALSEPVQRAIDAIVAEFRSAHFTIATLSPGLRSM